LVQKQCSAKAPQRAARQHPTLHIPFTQQSTFVKNLGGKVSAYHIPNCTAAASHDLLIFAELV